MKRDINQIAQELGLQLVSTTSEASGYPRNLRTAVIGFENWQQAEEVAAEIGGDIINLHKKEGWQLWARQGSASGPYENSAADYGDDYEELSAGDEDELTESLKAYMEGPREFSEIYDYVQRLKDIADEMAALEEGQVLICRDNSIVAVINKVSMAFSEDCNHYVIAVVKSEVDHE